MTFTDEDLARIEAACETVPKAYTACDHSEPMSDSEVVLYDFWLRVRTDLPALVAEVRELRQALVLALREAPDMAGCCEDCDAVMERRRAALAPFAHLGGEP